MPLLSIAGLPAHYRLPICLVVCLPVQCVDKSPAEAQQSSAENVVQVLKDMH